MKKFVQVPSRTEMILLATFEFASADMMANEDSAFSEFIHELTEGKMSISWKNGIMCADCPSEEFCIMPTKDDHSLDLFKVIKHPMVWKIGDGTNELSK